MSCTGENVDERQEMPTVHRISYLEMGKQEEAVLDASGRRESC